MSEGGPARRFGGRGGPGGRSGPGGRGRDRWAAPVDEPGMLRLFFAVPVSDDARAKVAELIESVQGSVGDGSARIRWVRVDGLHLTLRFLGPTPEDRRPPLEAAADAIGASMAPFDVRLAGGGAFPSLARPRSLWVADTSIRLRPGRRIFQARPKGSFIFSWRALPASLNCSITNRN